MFVFQLLLPVFLSTLVAEKEKGVCVRVVCSIECVMMCRLG
jgi:hypothetical protein